jgi:hypothetical protein
MSILPSIITTRFPQTVRSFFGTWNSRAFALRIIDSSIILILGCVLVTFLSFAFKVEGSRDNLFLSGTSGSSLTHSAEAPELSTPPLGTTATTPKRSN